MAGLISTTYEEPKKKTTQTAAAPAANNTAAQAAPTAIQMGYTDPNGNPAIGYSINNRMYKDAAGTQRIDEGSIVANQSGKQAWIMQNGAGVPIANYQPGANAAITNAYQSSVQAANKRLDANIAQIEANRPKINDAYDQLARQNYQGYMQSQEALANQLASQGLYNSGYSDTAKVAQNVGYRSAQSETERARLQALADLETEINVARLNGSANLSELEAEYAILQNEQANYEREFAYRAAQDLMNRNYQQNRDAIADQRYEQELATEDAWRRAENGDFSGLAAIGIDPTIYQANYDKAQQRADAEWDMFVEEHKAQMLQYASAEDQRLYENAVEQAKYGNFEPLRNLGMDTTAWETAYAKNQKLLDLEVQAAYQDLAIGNQQIAANNRTLQQEAEEEAANTDFNALYRADPGKYNQVIALAEQFAANNANSSNKTLSEQFLSAYDVAKNYYGEEYAELWRETVLAAMQPEEELTFEDFDKDSFINSWKPRIYSESTTTTTTGDDKNGTTTKTTQTNANVDEQKKAIKDLYFYSQMYNMSDPEFYAVANEIVGDVKTINRWLDQIDRGMW